MSSKLTVPFYMYACMYAFTFIDVASFHWLEPPFQCWIEVAMTYMLPFPSLWMKAFGLSYLSISFSKRSFIRLRKLLFITSLLTVFMGIRFCHMLYLCLLWWDWTFLLYPINVRYYLNWISDIKTTLDGWHKSLFVMLYNLFPF